MKEFEKILNTAWDNKDKINSKSDQSIIDAIKETIELVDKGKIRVAEKKGNEWIVHQWIKKAILLKKGKDKLFCSVCGMNLAMFYKTNHAAEVDGKVQQFCSMHCLVEATLKHKNVKNNLKLIGKNQEDLEVISAYSQDSIVAVKDMIFLEKNKIL